MELMQASRQWASRPADQRFTSLTDLQAFTQGQRQISRQMALSSRKVSAAPIAEDESRKSLVVVGPGDIPTVPSHWSFGQLAQRAGAPAGYLRQLPADIAADAINWGLMRRDVEDVGVLLRNNPGAPVDLAAMTGPQYGRIWNSDIIDALVKRFGDGITGRFKVPGEFGRPVDVTKDNTTLYASDRDIFVFLADEQNLIEVPDRRHGRSGAMSRGFFVWNSEVGSSTFGIATFLYDYVCANRIVWGAEGYQEFKIRHTSGAPDRWVEEVVPALQSYAEKSTTSITNAIDAARDARLGDKDKVAEFLQKRFTKSQATAISAAHMAEEDRPIETLWDVTVAATAYARGITHQDDRVTIEREAGKIMSLATK